MASITRKPKTVFALDSPFTAVSWPDTSKDNQETMLKLLSSVLAPIGQYRANHVTTPKGKRTRKRKRKEAKMTSEKAETPELPPRPEISSHIIVGLNSISRHLESLSEKSKLQVLANDLKDQNGEIDEAPADSSPGDEAKPLQPKEDTSAKEDSRLSLDRPFAVIFATQFLRPEVLYAHLPQLVVTASLAHPELPATRLVQLPKGSDAQLCTALGLQRVSFIGILNDAPHCQHIIELVRQSIAVVEVPWLEEAKKSQYQPVHVLEIETFAPVLPKKELKKL